MESRISLGMTKKRAWYEKREMMKTLTKRIRLRTESLLTTGLAVARRDRALE